MADGLRNFSTTAKNLNDVALAIQLVTQTFIFPSPRSLKHAFLQRAKAIAKRGTGLEGIEAELREMLTAFPFLELSYLAGSDGTMLACAVSPERSRGGRLPEGVEVGKNYSERPWFKTVQQTRSATITPLYESLFTSEQCFSVSVPVTTAGHQLGVLAADVNLSSWIKI